MNSTKKTWLFIFVILALTLTACGGKTVAEAEADKDGAETETEIDPEAIFTSAAATVAAQLTETAISFSPTPAPATATSTLLATATLVNLNQTPLPSPTGIGNATATLPPGVPTLTPSIPTLVPTAVSDPCDKMLYGAPLDITIPDGTSIKPGVDFYKIWRIHNNGECTWDDGYQLVPVLNARALDAANPAWRLDTVVLPGQNVDVGAHLTAPLAAGEYETCFRMMNDRGYLFGGVLCATIIVKAQ